MGDRYEVWACRDAGSMDSCGRREVERVPPVFAKFFGLYRVSGGIATWLSDHASVNDAWIAAKLLGKISQPPG